VKKSIAFVLFAAIAASPVPQLTAGIIAPIGLAPGTQYQLIFVTADTISAISTSEDPYNGFATFEATTNSSLPSATWSAVTSASDISAANIYATKNAPWLNLPVYNTHGVEVNLPGQSLYAGSLQNAVEYNQYGISDPGAVWTGSTSFGTAAIFEDMGQQTVMGGLDTATDGTWLDGSLSAISTLERPIYALSSAITMPAPEPATLTLLGSALAILGGARLLQRRKG
jgi:hypothetical protein